MTPFDFLNAINFDKKNLIGEDPSVEREYNAFMVNRGLSYFNDTILYANTMNGFPTLDNKIQFDFYLYAIPKRKRFSKWAKKDQQTNDLKTIMQYYKINEERALEALSILSSKQIEIIEQRMFKGGSGS